jgi:transcriptional regulator with XRE-family HTH domain
MVWIPKKDALRKFREAAGYSIYQLAERSGLSERQIRKLESESPPATMFGSTLGILTKVVACTKEDLATWAARKPVAANAAPKSTRAGKSSSRPRTLTEMATMERDSRHSGTIISPMLDTGFGELEMLGPERANEIDAQYALFEGERLIVGGVVEQHKPLPPDVARVIGSEPGVGGRFQLAREVFYDMQFRVTVLTPTAELTRHVMELQRDREPASVIVRVVIARPKNKWRGFVGLEKDSRPVPYAFVMEPYPIRPTSNLPS